MTLNKIFEVFMILLILDRIFLILLIPETIFLILIMVGRWSSGLRRSHFSTLVRAEPKTPGDASSSPGKFVLSISSILPASHPEVKSVLVGPSGTIR